VASTFVQWIDRQAWFHTLIRVLGVRPAASLFLRLFPVSRTFSSGTRVRVADLEAFFLRDEIFERETYRRALVLAGDVKTVVDIGCNVGFFCCYLRHYFQRTDFQGLCIDANSEVLKQTRHNLAVNGLSGIRSYHGLVGPRGGEATQDFYVYASHLGSSQFVKPESGRALKGKWKKVAVPVLKVSEIWQKEYGTREIDLLKIDIEGSEGALLTADSALFRQTKSLVVEWHKWLVEEAELLPVLHQLGFIHRELLETGKTADLWFFSRSPIRGNPHSAPLIGVSGES